MPLKKLLLIAYHFPPIQGSTGTVRTIAFSKYLRQFGWDVAVLTIRPEAYEDTAIANETQIPGHIRVIRAWGVNTKQSLSIMGKYPRLLALPDRWQSWIVGGYIKGCREIRQSKPDVIMTTYPIPSAHMIGYLLHRRFQLPWVAEFRDPMLQPRYPSNRVERWVFKKLERLVFAHSTEVVVTTEGCRRMYVDRYPNLDSSSITCISNGYDPESFVNQTQNQVPTRQSSKILLHSGLLYPHERNHSEFFRAVQALQNKGFFQTHNVRFHFRASGNEGAYLKTIRRLGIDSIIQFLPRISYSEAIAEMQQAHALMLFQADNCNDQIPAKVYEYIYSQKPILAFTDPCGDTGKLLGEVGVSSVAKLEVSQAIEVAIRDFILNLEDGTAYIVPNRIARRFSRETLTGDLNRVLTRAAGLPDTRK